MADNAIWITSEELDRFFDDTFGDAGQSDVYIEESNIPDELWEGDEPTTAHPVSWGTLAWQGRNKPTPDVVKLLDTDLVVLISRWRRLVDGSRTKLTVEIDTGRIEELRTAITALGGTIA